METKGGAKMNRKFYELDEESGCPESRIPLFHVQVEDRAEQILQALSGLKVCSALRLLDLCKDAVMQYPIKDD